MLLKLTTSSWSRKHQTTVIGVQKYSDKLSIAVILINTCQYGIPYTGIWLVHTMECVFWVYAALSVSLSAFLYLILWSTLYAQVYMLC